MNGALTVFPIAICFASFPATFCLNDVYQFARRFGSVEKVAEIPHSSNIEDLMADGYTGQAGVNSEVCSIDSTEGETAGEDIDMDVHYRVQYRERYVILLILQNRQALVVNNQPVMAIPLYK